jgi:hypothetical protein
MKGSNKGFDDGSSMAAMLKRRSLQRRWPDKETRQRLNHPYIMTPGLGFALGAMVCFGASDLIYKRAAAAGTRPANS